MAVRGSMVGMGDGGYRIPDAGWRIPDGGCRRRFTGEPSTRHVSPKNRAPNTRARPVAVPTAACACGAAPLPPMTDLSTSGMPRPGGASQAETKHAT